MSHVLFIKPRWLSAELADASIEGYLTANPGTLADALVDSSYASISRSKFRNVVVMPAARTLRSGAVLVSLARIWMSRYYAVVVLIDEGRDEAGYGEAKAWAFAARARIRMFGSVRRISLEDEMWDKWRRVVSQTLAKAVIRAIGTVRRVPRLAVALREKQRLAAFITLNEHDRIFGKHRGHLLWDMNQGGYAIELAREMGWQVETPDATSGANRFDFAVSSISSRSDLDLANTFRTIVAVLSERGSALLRIRPHCDMERLNTELGSVAKLSGAVVIRVAASRLSDGEIDAWIQRSA